jgi:hypothetical protein
VNRAGILDKLEIKLAFVHPFQEGVNGVLGNQRIQSAVKNEEFGFCFLAGASWRRKERSVKGYDPCKRRSRIGECQRGRTPETKADCSDFRFVDEPGFQDLIKARPARAQA